MQRDFIVNMDLYLALQDEVWRLNAAIHNRHLKPSIYRHGKTFSIYGIFLESDIVWFRTYEMVPYDPYLHIRIPYISDEVLFCHNETEWMSLLAESSVLRNHYFDAKQCSVNDRLITAPLPR